MRTERKSFVETKTNDDYNFDPYEMQKMISFYNSTNDTEAKKEIMQYFLNSLKGIMTDECNKFKNNRHSFDELMVDCQIAVIEAIPGYEPIDEKGNFRRPSTYFGFKIRHAVQELYNPEAMTGHYANIERKLKKAASAYSIPYEKEYIRRLAKIADIAYQSAMVAYARSNTTHEEYNPETISEQSENFGQPEAIYEEKEKCERIRSLVNGLPVIERYVISQTIFEEVPIEEVIKNMQEDNGMSLSKKDVIKIQHSAYNKLEPLLRKQGYGGRQGFIKPVFIKSDEELDEEMMDIAAAFDNDAGSSILIKLNV